MPNPADHFKSLFEYAPISLWEEDFSGLKSSFDQFRNRGITDLAQYLDEHPAELEAGMRRIKVTRVNQRTLEMFKAETLNDLVKNLDRVFRDEMRVHLRSELLALWDGHTDWSGEGINYTLAGEPLNIRLRLTILPECRDNWECVMVAIEDITPLKRAETRYHNLFAHAPISLWEEDYSGIKALFDELRAQGVTNLEAHLAGRPELVDRFMGLIRVLDVNRRTLNLFGADSKEALLSNLDKVFRDEMSIHFTRELVDMWNGRTSYEREGINYSLNGDPINVHLDWQLMPGYENDFSWVQVALQDITARKKAEDYLRYLGTHDVMTGLFNRAYFEEQILHLEKDRQDPISIIIADLNGLKETNDNLGHPAGDNLIRRAAEVLRANADDRYTVARIGGDEFAILMPDCNEQAATEAMEHIHSLVVLNNKYYREPILSISIGAATSQPGLSIEKVINAADDAMYEDKGRFYHRRKEDRWP
jgi:diguanylate cyclase (GGDEF)-like protein